MMPSYALLAEAGSRATLDWGRIDSGADLIIPIAVLAAIVVYVRWMYLRDSRELRRPISWLLTVLRCAVFVGLLLVYLDPQWRNDREVVRNSRVLLLVDTSLSMGLPEADPAAASTGPSRADRAIWAVAGSDLVQKLRRTHEVVVLRFDRDASRVAALAKLAPGESAGGAMVSSALAAGKDSAAAAVDWKRALTPKGSETRLGQTLRQLIEDERAGPVSGIIVLTDGGQNAGIEPTAAVELAREAKIPIFAIGLGSDRQPASVRVSDLLAPARAYPGDSYTVTGYLQAYGLKGKTVKVDLTSRTPSRAGATAPPAAGKLEGTQSVTLGNDGEVLPVKFQLTPAEAGRRTLRLEVAAPAEDPNTAAHRQEVDVEVVDHKTRVLLFAGGPGREYQFLRNQLQRDKSVTVDVLLQTARPGMSQESNKILDAFPGTREELYAYDAIVAFDPDWRSLDDAQIDLLERWVADQAGGLVLVAGPVNTDAWVQDRRMAKIRALYPVEFYQRFAMLDDARFGSKEPWPIDLTREGLDAEFLWLDDTSSASRLAWAGFRGVYGFYATRGPKPGATVYGRYSDPRAGGAAGQPVYLAGQFFGSGRVFYLASGEMWRLRAVDDVYFEQFYTKLIRHVSQGRLLRGSSRGALLVEQDRYLLGNTVAVRAQLTNVRLEPLEMPSVSLDVIQPDGRARSVSLAADPTRAGMYAGQFTVLEEGAYRLELLVPESNDERLARRIQVRVPDLERENPRRNDALLYELANGTGGRYYVGLEAAFGAQGTPPLVAQLQDRSRTTILSAAPEPLWDKAWVMCALCGVLCSEWLIRRLLRLA